MDGDLHIIDYRGLLVIEVMVEKFDFFMVSDNSAQLRDLLEERHYPSIIFDFNRVSLIDSSVFGFLLEVQNSVKKNGRGIAIVCNDPKVLHVMAMLKVPQIIRVLETREQAFEYLDNLQ